MMIKPPVFLQPISWRLPAPVVAQHYETEVNNEFVITGNSAILKCHIPSFVADFVSVQAWVDNDGTAIYPSKTYGNDKRGGRGAWRGKLWVKRDFFSLVFGLDCCVLLTFLSPFYCRIPLFFLILILKLPFQGLITVLFYCILPLIEKSASGS